MSERTIAVRTFMATKKGTDRSWHKVDASGRILGRMAVEVANLLRGKNKPIFTPHVDMGDFVVVVNAEKIRVTGKKMEQKEYQRYSGHMGGLKRTPLADLMKRDPSRVVRLAVQRMLPKTKLGKFLIRKLKVYAGPAHPHGAQNPADYVFKN